MIGSVFRLLHIVLTQVLLNRHRFHGPLFLWKHRRNVHEGRRDEAAEFRLMRLEPEEFRRRNGGKAAGHTGSTGQQTGPLGRRRGQRMIWINGSRSVWVTMASGAVSRMRSVKRSNASALMWRG